MAFLAPGAIWLVVVVIYPVIATIRYSFYNESATKAVGLANYRAVFSTNGILVTFRNNVIWVVVFPFVVTVIGLLIAVLTERIRWATAFKTIIFLPVVFSVTASSLVWRTIFDLNPSTGVVNAAEQAIDDVAFEITLPDGLRFVSGGQQLAERTFRFSGRLNAGSNPIPIAVKGPRAGRYKLIAHAIGHDLELTHEVVLEVTS